MLRLFARAALAILSAGSVVLIGCHSAMIDTSLQNRSGGPSLSWRSTTPAPASEPRASPLVQTSTIASKVLGSGPLKLTYSDSLHHDHTETGPT